jgi:hypothetical protein
MGAVVKDGISNIKKLKRPYEGEGFTLVYHKTPEDLMSLLRQGYLLRPYLANNPKLQQEFQSMFEAAPNSLDGLVVIDDVGTPGTKNSEQEKVLPVARGEPANKAKELRQNSKASSIIKMAIFKYEINNSFDDVVTNDSRTFKELEQAIIGSPATLGGLITRTSKLLDDWVVYRAWKETGMSVAQFAARVDQLPKPRFERWGNSRLIEKIRASQETLGGLFTKTEILQIDPEIARMFDAFAANHTDIDILDRANKDPRIATDLRDAIKSNPDTFGGLLSKQQALTHNLATFSAFTEFSKNNPSISMGDILDRANKDRRSATELIAAIKEKPDTLGKLFPNGKST